MWLHTKATIGETCSISKFPRWVFFWSTTQRDLHRHGSFCCHLLQNLKYPPPRWFIESLFYYIKHKSFSQLCKISTCISFPNKACLSMYNYNVFSKEGIGYPIRI